MKSNPAFSSHNRDGKGSNLDFLVSSKPSNHEKKKLSQPLRSEKQTCHFKNSSWKEKWFRSWEIWKKFMFSVFPLFSFFRSQDKKKFSTCQSSSSFFLSLLFVPPPHRGKMYWNKKVHQGCSWRPSCLLYNFPFPVPSSETFLSGLVVSCSSRATSAFFYWWVVVFLCDWDSNQGRGAWSLPQPNVWPEQSVWLQAFIPQN